MTLTTVNTEHFSDVEVAARTIAQQVEDLQARMSTARTLAEASWMGDACNEFSNLYCAISMQMADISDEFWDMFDALCEAEGAFLESDQSIATQIDSYGTVSVSSDGE